MSLVSFANCPILHTPYRRGLCTAAMPCHAMPCHALYVKSHAFVPSLSAALCKSTSKVERPKVVNR